MIFSKRSPYLADVCFVGYQDAKIPVDDNEPLVHCVENVPDELLTLSNLRLLILRLIAQESKYAL